MVHHYSRDCRQPRRGGHRKVPKHRDHDKDRYGKRKRDGSDEDRHKGKAKDEHRPDKQRRNGKGSDKMHYGVAQYIRPGGDARSGGDASPGGDASTGGDAPAVLATALHHPGRNMDLILDHGSTVNVCCHREAFTSMDPEKTQLSWFNNSKIDVSQGMATLMLYDSVRKHTMPLTMHMKHSPHGVSILSHARLVNDHGFKGQLSKDQSTFQYRNQHMCIQFKVQADELFHATAKIGHPTERPTRTLATRATVDERTALHNKLRKWHNRLAHANMDTIKAMAKHEMVADMTLDKGDFGAKATCSACLQGKMKRMSYKKPPDKRPSRCTS